MNLQPLIGAIVSEAAGPSPVPRSRRRARADIARRLNHDYPQLSPADRRTVTDGVMDVLEHDDFFGMEFAGGAFDEEPGTEDES